ncbi:hypothetical protein NKG99_21040 [Mesorhizobium sp. M1409]
MDAPAFPARWKVSAPEFIAETATACCSFEHVVFSTSNSACRNAAADGAD